MAQDTETREDRDDEPQRPALDLDFDWSRERLTFRAKAFGWSIALFLLVLMTAATIYGLIEGVWHVGD